MSVGLGILLTFGLFLGLLIVGLSVPVAIALPALVLLVIQGGFSSLNSLGFIAWGSMSSFTLTAVPLFILMAEILSVSGLSARIYRGLSKLVSGLPGGLLQTNIAGCAIFSAVSGSSVATAASIGRVALPQLLSRNYARPISAGSLAAGGTLGILIPPSIAMIIYGTFTQTSVPQLFMAGMVPGLLLTLLFMIYIGLHATLFPAVAPREKLSLSLREVMTALGDVSPFAILIAGTLGLLYLGIVTTTEAATIGCILAAILAMIFGNLTIAGLVDAIRSTVLMVGSILFLILAAFLFSAAISFSGIGIEIVNFVVSLELTRLEFFVSLFIIFTVLGCLIESLGMIVITVPLIFPMLGNYGIDPLLFGVVLVLFVELAQITPPMGINLFIIQGIWDGNLGDVVKGAIPFAIIMFLTAGLLVLWPAVALWLPQQMTN
jgi:tripartite ATP-independent transporter DctM subunit